MSAGLALTWWGHASTTVELGGVRVAVDPLLVDRLFHLRRYAASPSAGAFDADVVVVSHLHADHFHVPSLRRLAPGATLVVPIGSEGLARRLGFERVLGASPGGVLEGAGLRGLRIEVLGATHDGRRHPLSRVASPAVGYRVSSPAGSFWFPGDTELRPDMADVAPVDLALAPVGGWGPSLGAGHMDPAQAADAVRRVGARWAVPVHWGTFWPVGLERVDRATHRRLFTTPGSRFADALTGRPAGGASGEAPGAAPVLAAHGERVVL